MRGVQTCQRSLPAHQIITNPADLRWGIVSTVKAPLAAIARFAAWHLDLGADRIDLYLDAPCPRALAVLGAHPRLAVIACDDSYWRGAPPQARQSHQRRQAYNASRSYRHSALHWLAHIDVDEFILPDRPLPALLAEAPAGCAGLHLAPAERLAGDGDTDHFKRTPKSCGQPTALSHRLYPEFADLLPQGFVSYTTHKIIARTGLGALRFGIHQLSAQGERLINLAGTDAAVIGHAHTQDFEHFKSLMNYRLTNGSYRNRKNGNPRLHAILTELQKTEGVPGLRRFYDEICTARPRLLDLLRAHDMLISKKMSLAARVRAHFGDLPPDPENGA